MSYGILCVSFVLILCASTALQSQDVSVRVLSGNVTEDNSKSSEGEIIYYLQADQETGEVEISPLDANGNTDAVSLLLFPSDGKLSISWRGAKVGFSDNQWFLGKKNNKAESVMSSGDWISLLFYQKVSEGSVSLYIDGELLGEIAPSKSKKQTESDIIRIKLEKGNSEVSWAMVRWGSLEFLLKNSDIGISDDLPVNPIVQMGPLVNEMSPEEEAAYLLEAEAILANSEMDSVSRIGHRNTRGNRNKKHRRHRHGAAHGVFTSFTK